MDSSNNRSWLLVLTSLAAACAAPSSAPACPTATHELRITWEGPIDCVRREDAIAGPWLDLDRCEVTLWLPAGVTCDVVGGRDLGLEGGRARCAIDQLPVADRSEGAPPPEGQGWFFDDFTDDMPCPLQTSPNDIRLLPEPPLGTEITLSCVLPEAPAGGPNAGCFYAGDVCDPGLSCDPVRDRCSAPCTDDAACEAAGLSGWICDRRPRREIDPRERDDTPNDFCVNPTCEMP